ncbi:MAG: D-sedoheptulose 7-phosphate isomerase [Deltaproteobacteria bacterium]|jgi:D-sedoheptulose 7-phosphate isomerase|nr:D-sedoheptulose 7-phosphate isomerase [Deltaproteobacteria bacterium]
MQDILRQSLENSIKAKEDFVSSQEQNLLLLVDVLVASFQRGGKLLLFGNGGSAADAQHLAAEFVNRFLIDRKPLPALALTTDSSILTSIGNDFSYDDIFSKQIHALGKKEDVALGISTSGNSPNVVNAIQAAREIGMHTAVLTGGNGGKLASEAELVLNVPSDKTPHIQETHIWIEHMLCWLVDERMFGSLVNE